MGDSAVPSSEKTQEKSPHREIGVETTGLGQDGLVGQGKSPDASVQQDAGLGVRGMAKDDSVWVEGVHLWDDA